MTLRQLLPRLGISLLVLLIADQVALYTLLANDTLFGRPVAPFDPPLFTQHQRETLARIEAELARKTPGPAARRFDAELGWSNEPDSGRGEFHYDWAGCRIGSQPLSATKEPGRRRLLTLGCSMTHGEEVGALETWPAILDELRDDVEVGNLGVAAYGLDQALLRYRRDGVALEADEVWMGFLPTAALRTTTLFRPLVRHWALAAAFKPRFALDAENRLRLVGNPAESLEQVARLLTQQDEFLAAVGHDDVWVERARAAYAPRGSHLLHYSFAGRVLLTVHEALDRDFADHFARTDGETYRLLRAIVIATAEEVERQGARFRFLILPGEECLDDRLENGAGYWQGLCEDLQRAGIEVIDLSETLEDCGLSRERLFQPEGHYSPAANRVVATQLSSWMSN